MYLFIFIPVNVRTKPVAVQSSSPQSALGQPLQKNPLQKKPLQKKPLQNILRDNLNRKTAKSNIKINQYCSAVCKNFFALYDY